MCTLRSNLFLLRNIDSLQSINWHCTIIFCSSEMNNWQILEVKAGLKCARADKERIFVLKALLYDLNVHGSSDPIIRWDDALVFHDFFLSLERSVSIILWGVHCLFWLRHVFSIRSTFLEKLKEIGFIFHERCGSLRVSDKQRTVLAW